MSEKIYTQKAKSQTVWSRMGVEPRHVKKLCFSDKL